MEIIEQSEPDVDDVYYHEESKSIPVRWIIVKP